MRRLHLPLYAVLALVLTTAACDRTSSEADRAPSDSASPVVARFGDQVVTVADVDARVLALPPGERPKPGDDLEAWYAEQIRDLAVDRLLLEEARAQDLQAEAGFAAAQREAEKQIGLQLCLAEIRPDVPPLTEEDLRAAYETQADRLAAPERRALYQIFLRRKPGAEKAIEELRDRALAGENFLHLAAEHSESESRHREGFIGWMTPGQLPAGFEEIVWDLEEGVPSRPVPTREGFHLFYVNQVLAARSLTYEEARRVLAQRLLSERNEATLAELDATVEPPEGSVVLDRQELAEVVQGGDGSAVVLRMGDVTWTLADLRRQVQELLNREGQGSQAPTFELVWRVLEQARRREEIYQTCRAEERIPQEALQTHLERWREKSLVEAERHRRLTRIAQADSERLRLFYESNLGEFSTAPTWTLRRLHRPLGEQPMAAMARLEAASQASGASLDSLQAELGGEIEELEPKSLTELGRLQPKLPKLVAPLRPGQLSAPFRSQRGLEIVQVVARSDAEPIPFEEVRDRVAARYVQQYTAELYRRLARELLGEDELRIDEEALAEMRRAGLPQPDVTVEELEALLAES